MSLALTCWGICMAAAGVAWGVRKLLNRKKPDESDNSGI